MTDQERKTALEWLEKLPSACIEYLIPDGISKDDFIYKFAALAYACAAEIYRSTTP